MELLLSEDETLECTECFTGPTTAMTSYVNFLSECKVHGKVWHRLKVKKENRWEIKNPVSKEHLKYTSLQDL